MSTTILALDLGTSTGWAMRTADGHIVSGVESFKPGRFEGGGMRYLRFKRWLTDIKATTDGIDALFFEEVRRHRGVDASHVYGGLMATLTAWAEHHSIPYQGVPVGSIKKAATGKGNASKDDVLAAMHLLGHNPSDDNEADALALLTLATALADSAEGNASPLAPNGAVRSPAVAVRNVIVSAPKHAKPIAAPVREIDSDVLLHAIEQWRDGDPTELFVLIDPGETGGPNTTTTGNKPITN